MPGTSAGESRFWQFSLDFYSSAKVRQACLELQDRAGADVNVLFFVLFLATHQRKLNRADVTRIDAAIKAWREQAVLPLRALRRQLKTGIAPLSTADTDDFRSAVKRIELEAERLEQQWLERNLPPASIGEIASSKIAAAQANVAAYNESLDGVPDAPVVTLLFEFSTYVAR